MLRRGHYCRRQFVVLPASSQHKAAPTRARAGLESMQGGCSPKFDDLTTLGLESALSSTTCVVVKAMCRTQSLPIARQPAVQALRRAWPSDTVLKRRRSVLFAFTFSPHLA